ncbi:MAG: hypothetical protein FJ151_00650, partial [Euryarchaeota archaeon]|nr:hypothetical protein [Euryarchaeota archaeon]
MKAKKRFVKDLQVGEEVDDLFSVKFKKPPRPYSKGFMFEARVSDRTGQINVKYWGSPNEEETKKTYELV